MTLNVNESIRLLVLVFLLFIFSGCATVKYDKLDPETGKVKEKDYGVVFYEEKPFLLVQYHSDGKGGHNAVVSQIILPDKTKPYKARVVQGFGSAELNLNLQHNVLTSTIGKTNNDETMAGMLNALGTLAKVPTEIFYQAAQTAELEETIKNMSFTRNTDCDLKYTWKWQKLMKDAWKLLEKTSETSLGERTKVVDAMKAWQMKLCISPEANLLRKDLYTVDQIKIFKEALYKFKEGLSSITKKLTKYKKDEVACDQSPDTDECVTIAKAQKKIDKIGRQISAYLPEEAESIPPFELYEIEYDFKGNFKGLNKHLP